MKLILGVIGDEHCEARMLAKIIRDEMERFPAIRVVTDRCDKAYRYCAAQGIPVRIGGVDEAQRVLLFNREGDGARAAGLRRQGVDVEIWNVVGSPLAEGGSDVGGE